MPHSLKEYRDAIDKIDNNLLELLEERAKIATEVGRLKKEEASHPIYYRPEREAQMFRKKLQNYQGYIPKADVMRVFRSVLSACRSLQERCRVVCLGPEGTFSHAATLKHFGSNIEVLFVNSLSQVFQEVENDKAGFGVVPIENSTSGIISETADAFFQFSLQVCGEVMLPINFHLLRVADAEEKLMRIYGHPQSKRQCSIWLANEAANVEFIEASSSTDAILKAKQDKQSAALAGNFGEDNYDMVRHVSNVENKRHNATRFLVIGKQKVDVSGLDKTALLLHLNNAPGELFQVLKVLAEQKINLALIESRPSQDPNWKHQFYVECDGHAHDEKLQVALQSLNQSNVSARVLGSFPKLIAEEG